MRLGKHRASDAHAVGLVVAAPQNGPADAPAAGHVVCVCENAGFLMLMMLA